MRGHRFGGQDVTEPHRGDYLHVKPYGWFGEVVGDGSEAGLDIEVTYTGSRFQKPFVEIPAADNHCGAVVEAISKPRHLGHGMLGCTIRVSTEAKRDTGSCLIWIRQADGSTAALVGYAYSVDE